MIFFYLSNFRKKFRILFQKNLKFQFFKIFEKEV